MSGFAERLRKATESQHSLLCVGLDPDPNLMPVADVLEFNQAIVDATSDLACAYKPQLSFYYAMGHRGIAVLERTVKYIRSEAPEAILICDGKFGDIGSTMAQYARATFETFGFDAATVNGYGGGESLEPFLSYADRGVFVWCRSSNTGAREIQDVNVPSEEGDMPFYELLAMRASRWNVRGNVGVVAGATYPEDIRVVRSRCPGMPVLVPGIGAQKGHLGEAVRAGLDCSGYNLLINSSRGILYASGERSSFAGAAREAALNLRDGINRILDEAGRGWLST